MIFRDNSVLAIKGSENTIEQIKQLIEITSLYLGTPYFDRVSYFDMENLKTHYPEFQTLITFRNFEKKDFEDIIKSGLKLPAGITRVFLPKRALGLNIPLDFLKSDLTLDEKNRWLDEMIIKQVRSRAIRFYREPTFRFDE